MDAGDARIDRVDAVGELRDHSAAGVAVCDELLRFFDSHLRDQGRLVGEIAVHAFDVREEGQLLRLQRARDGAGSIVRVDVVGLVILVETDAADNRQIVLLKEIIDDLRVRADDISDEADVFAVDVALLALQKVSVLAADADRLHAQGVDHGDQALVHAAQDHLGDLHGLGVSDAEALHELRLFADLGDPLGDLLAAAVDDDRLEADQF